MEKPELLAPAGNWECARAAVANGADAVFFGLPAFNARMRADNFTEEELPAFMMFLHAHNVRGYLTLNILVFPEELAEAERFLRVAESAGVDAVLVQDLGIVRLARATAPNLAVHASTQMTITSPEGIHFAKTLGIERVVVARELSLRELVKFREDDPDMLPVETFVHGALCVAYSGQCLTSESLGQRSANRGECAQACRLPYELIVDGEKRDMGDKRYLLSPQDLAAIDDIPALIDAGICSFKIEGRLKTPEYVAAVTQVYRKAIDRALEDRPNFSVPDEDRYKLEMTFSRGLFSGWMHGVDHQRLVHARYGKKRGPFAGTVAAVGGDHVEFASRVELKPGDGVVFDTGGNPDDEQGGRIFEIRGDRYFFQRQKIDFNRLKRGDRVWKTSDPALERELKKSFAGEISVPERDVSCVVSGQIGSPLRVEICCGETIVAAESTMLLEKARARALSEVTMREHLGRLGGSGFSLAHFSNEVMGDVFLPVSELNELRRRCIAALDEQLDRSGIAVRVSTEPVLAGFLERISARRSQSLSDTIELSVLCRTPGHIQAALESGIKTIHVDFEDIRRYPDAVASVRLQADARIFLATPRIQKAGEQGFFKLIESAGSDGVLIRNLGGLAHFKHSSLRKVGDFSLNVANPLTAELLMEQGFENLTISYDLNHSQVERLLEAAPPEWFEVTIHQHMPLFHMEHCVFAAFLSNGHTHLDCGRPCERHDLRLRDRLGVDHPVKVDVGCRNTVFHAKAQSGASFLDGFVARGLRRVRVELVDEKAQDARSLIHIYQDLIERRIDGRELVSRLKVASQLGVTEGTLAVLR